jgi:hypothetical protein
MKALSIRKATYTKRVETHDFGMFKVVETYEQRGKGSWKLTDHVIRMGKEAPKDSYLGIKNEGFQELIRVWNPFHGSFGKKDKVPAWMTPEQFEKLTGKNWGAIKGNPSLKEIQAAKKSDLVFMRHSDHTLWGIDGSMIALPQSASYIGTPFSSGFTGTRKRLGEMRDHLLKKKEVLWISEIEEIPYYNNDTGSDTYFSVFISPTQRTWNRLLRIAGEKDIRKTITGEIVTHHWLEDVQKYDWLNLLQFEDVLRRDR